MIGADAGGDLPSLVSTHRPISVVTLARNQRPCQRKRSAVDTMWHSPQRDGHSPRPSAPIVTIVEWCSNEGLGCSHEGRDDELFAPSSVSPSSINARQEGNKISNAAP